MENRISLTIDEEAASNIEEAIQNLNRLLLPILIELGDGEAKEMPHMGDKSYAFATKALEFATRYPEFAALIDVPEFEKDLIAFAQLREIYIPIAQLAKKLHDTILLAGSEAQVAALTYYGTAKEARKRNIPNSILVSDELGQRFPGRSKIRKSNYPK